MVARFKDRTDAGTQLADRVEKLGLIDPVVLALPRGGVPVALPVAARLQAPLDLVLVRKIGAPGHEEFAIGAVVDGDEPDVVWNDEAQVLSRLSPHEREKLVSAKLQEIDARRSAYLGDRPPVPLKNKDAVLVDDGIATGSTVKAALKALRRRQPGSITLAVPVAPEDALDSIRPYVDRIVCLSTPFPFFAVGAHYVDFQQTSDSAVIEAMAEAKNDQEER